MLMERIIRQIYHINQVHAWLETNGEIARCDVIRKGYGYWLDLEYVYHVEGQVYYGHDICVESFFVVPFSSFSKQLSSRLVKAFHDNNAISVFFDPKRPSQAVLARPRPVRLYFISLVLLFFTIIHIIWLFLS